MSQQVRFAPGVSLDVVYVRAGHVTVSRPDGSEVAIASGHHPAWEDSATVVFCPPEEGVVQMWASGPHNGGELQMLGPYVPTVPAGNTLTASAGKVAVHRTDPLRLLCSWDERPIHHATDPVLSADGMWLAYLLPDWPGPGVSSVQVEAAHDRHDSRRVYTGAPLRPRFSNAGTSLTWEEAGGQIYGIADVANPQSPVVRLSRPEDAMYHPVPCWHPERGELFVLTIQDDGLAGRIVLAEWGSCVAQQPVGYALGDSMGSGYTHDVKPVGRDASVAFLLGDGTLVRATAHLDERRFLIALPIAPPVVEPPQPVPPDIEWTTDPHGVVEDIWPWIANNATALSPDGRVAWILKSDERNVEGQTHGEHWDADATYIGHLEDSSTGYRWWAAGHKRVNAIDWVNLGEPEPWFNLPLERNCFDAGARLWLPRRCVTGYRQKFVTNIRWSPSGYVQPNIPMETRVDVGYARFNGREAFVRGVYSSSGDGGHTFNDETNYYGPDGWTKHVPAGSTT